MFETIRKIHFVGVGGSGMSGIAEVLLNLGFEISGSDLKESETTNRLKVLGAKIYQGHEGYHVGDAQVVVTSTAVQNTNPEVLFARGKNIPVIPRIEMLAEIARLKHTIAIAGTHGKTTTTSMVASILQEGGLDPTFIIGGRLNRIESGARLGTGKYLVAEADESDGSFLKLSPTISIITNIDNDHLDYYQSMVHLRKAFIEFANRVPFYGCTIVCADDPVVRSVLPSFNRRVITYGFERSMHFSAQDIVSRQAGTEYSLAVRGKVAGRVLLKLPGRHNVLNSLAAFACGLELQIPFEAIADTLKHLESVERRFQKRGEKNGVVWVDDYGHHPTEIKATLSAMKEKYPDKRLVVLFQPHRYSRTKNLLSDFGKSFGKADEVILLPIYPAGEKPIKGVESAKLVPLIRKSGVSVSLQNGKSTSLSKYVKQGNIFLTLGAGDVWKKGQELFK